MEEVLKIQYFGIEYVGKIQHEEIAEQKNLQLQNCKNYSSRDVKNTV